MYDCRLRVLYQPLCMLLLLQLIVLEEQKKKYLEEQAKNQNDSTVDDDELLVCNNMTSKPQAQFVHPLTSRCKPTHRHPHRYRCHIHTFT